jgi:hypothetical protein
MDTGALCSGGDAYAHNAPARNARRRVRRAISLVWQRTVRRSEYCLSSTPRRRMSSTTAHHLMYAFRGGEACGNHVSSWHS